MTASDAPARPPRRRILDAAAHLLSTSAIADVSTREVQSLAGVTAPTLYHHFTDKTGLLDAVVEDAFTQYLADKHSAVAGLSPLAALRAGWDMHVEFGLAHPALYALMYADPHGRRDVPAARMARERLGEEIGALERHGLLVLPPEEAVDLVEAAAVGTTLQLLRVGGDARSPFSIRLRDTTLAQLTGDGPEPGRSDVATAARVLAAALPRSGGTPLSETERALLGDWLARLARA